MTRAPRDALVLLVVGVLLGGCLRAPIGDDYGDGTDDVGSSGGPDSTGLGASESPREDDSSGETSSGSEGDCHASYEPCLPIVGDLNCSDVIALGAAPVMVVGPDDYGLDSDNDGVGCEQ